MQLHRGSSNLVMANNPPFKANFSGTWSGKQDVMCYWHWPEKLLLKSLLRFELAVLVPGEWSINFRDKNGPIMTSSKTYWTSFWRTLSGHRHSPRWCGSIICAQAQGQWAAIPTVSLAGKNISSAVRVARRRLSQQIAVDESFVSIL